MSRFILADPSLERIGGHNLEYARHTLMAARDRGYQVHLAAHRGFPNGLAGTLDWPVYRVFRQSWYRTRQTSTQPAAAAILRSWRNWRQNRRSTAFARDCERLFQALGGPLRDDRVFFAMMSVSELSALVDFLDTNPWTRDIRWLAQFHHPPPAAGDADQAGRFAGLQESLDRHRLHCFATTDTLAAEYRRLGLRDTRCLPYPADPQLRPRADGAPTAGFNLVFAGHPRGEKGPGHLAELADHLPPGRAKLWVQGRPRRLRGLLPRRSSPRPRRGFPGKPPSDPVNWVPHPLSTLDYRRYILGAHIGWLMYDRQAYQTRCSGALVEFLCAGIPVVVTAGSWLAEQIADANYRYHDSLLQERSLGRWHELSLRPSSNRSGADRGEAGLVTLDAEIPAGTTAVMLLGDWPAGPSVGGTLDLDIIRAPAGFMPSRISLSRRGDGPASALVPASDIGGNLRMRLSVPARLRLLCLYAGPGRMPALGAVGLAAGNAREAAACVTDILAHYPHYRDAAVEFAAQWRNRHSPAALLRELELTMAGA